MRKRCSVIYKKQLICFEEVRLCLEMVLSKEHYDL